MWKLHRYIATTVLTTSLIIFCVVCGLYLIFTYIAEAPNIGQGVYGPWEAFEFVLLGLPANIYLILPIVALLGSLMGLGLLASHSELIAMRAAGISIRQIAQGAFYAGLIIAIIAFMVGSYIGPKLSEYATIKRTIEMQGQAVLMTDNSTWLKQDNHFIFIGKVAPGGHLYNIRRYQVVDNKLTEVDTADEAYYQNKQWYVKNITAITFTPLGVVEQHVAETTWKSLVSPQLLQVFLTKANSLTLNNLWSYINYRRINGLSTTSYELSFWQTFFQPLSVIILGLLAVPFVFGPLRSSNAGLRMIAGVAIGFVFFIINQFFGPFTGVYDFPPLLGALLPALIFALILVLMIWRIS